MRSAGEDDAGGANGGANGAGANGRPGLLEVQAAICGGRGGAGAGVAGGMAGSRDLPLIQVLISCAVKEVAPRYLVSPPLPTCSLALCLPS